MQRAVRKIPDEGTEKPGTYAGSGGRGAVCQRVLRVIQVVRDAVRGFESARERFIASIQHDQGQVRIKVNRVRRKIRVLVHHGEGTGDPPRLDLHFRGGEGKIDRGKNGQITGQDLILFADRVEKPHCVHLVPERSAYCNVFSGNRQEETGTWQAPARSLTRGKTLFGAQRASSPRTPFRERRIRVRTWVPQLRIFSRELLSSLQETIARDALRMMPVFAIMIHVEQRNWLMKLG